MAPREGEGRMHYPYGVAVDERVPRAAVSEPLERRCQIFVDRGDAPADAPPPVGEAADFGPLMSTGGDLLAVFEPQTRSIIVYYTARPVPIEITRFGEAGERYGQLGRISGLCVDAPRRRLYVADAANQRLNVFELNFDAKGPLRQDPTMSRFVKSVDFAAAGGAGTIPLRPGPVAVGSDGRVYVLDEVLAQVSVLESSLELPQRWGNGAKAGEVELGRPRALAVGADGKMLYVADVFHRAVLAFGPDGDLLGLIGGPDVLVAPAAISVEADGTVNVADAGSDEVVRFDAGGKAIGRFGGSGSEPGSMWWPAGIGRDGQGRLAVLDYGNHRIQLFDDAGRWQVTFGTGRAYTRHRPPAPPAGR
jgi:DNA-binding beta-propeller fold protein YncE